MGSLLQGFSKSEPLTLSRPLRMAISSNEQEQTVWSITGPIKQTVDGLLLEVRTFKQHGAAFSQ